MAYSDKIEMIKFLREITGMGLKEAKGWVLANCTLDSCPGSANGSGDFDLILVAAKFHEEKEEHGARLASEVRKMNDYIHTLIDEKRMLGVELSELKARLRRALEVIEKAEYRFDSLGSGFTQQENQVLADMGWAECNEFRTNNS